MDVAFKNATLGPVIISHILQISAIFLKV